MKKVKLLMLCMLILIISIEAGSQDIFNAIEKNNLIQVKALIEANPQLVTTKDETGDTPLHHAAWQKQPETASFLISKGADVSPTLFPILEGQYLGQNQPDSIPLIFAVGIISSIWGLHSSLAFSTDGDYLIYCSGLELCISFKEKDGTWSAAKNIGSPVNTGFELCPIVTPDGKYIIFLSGREGESHAFWVSAKVIDDLRHEDLIEIN